MRVAVKFRVCRAVDASTAAHERYDFGEAGRQAHDLFWLDFADWYIEAAKARLHVSSSAEAACTRRVLVYMLERSLRLWHPFMPFITEQLWQAIPHRGEALIVASWPQVNAPQCKDALRLWGGTLRAVVTAVRRARADYQVDQANKVAAVVVAGQPAVQDVLLAESSAICLLAKIEPAEFRVRLAKRLAWPSILKWPPHVSQGLELLTLQMCVRHDSLLGYGCLLVM